MDPIHIRSPEAGPGCVIWVPVAVKGDRQHNRTQERMPAAVTGGLPAACCRLQLAVFKAIDSRADPGELLVVSDDD